MYHDLDHFHLQIQPNLSLVAPQMIHAKAVYELIQSQRAYFSAWLSWVEHTQSINDVRRFIRESQAFNEGGQRLTAFVRYQNQIVGSAGFTRLNMRHRKGELGYWLSKHLQGRGLISQACLKLLEYAFSELDLNRVEIRVLADNEKSKGIPRRLGFQPEGILRQSIWLHNQYHDMEIFGLLASRWQLQKGEIMERVLDVRC